MLKKKYLKDTLYPAATWYPLIEEVLANNSNYLYVFVFQKDNKAYKVFLERGGKEYHGTHFELAGIPVDSELVIFESSRQTKNCHNEVEEVYSTYSISNKACKAAFDIINLHVNECPKLEYGRVWSKDNNGNFGYAELTEPDGACLKAMDKFYYLHEEFYSSF